MFKIENRKNPTTIEVNSIMSLHNVGEYKNAIDEVLEGGMNNEQG